MENEYPIIKVDNDYYYRKYGHMWAKPNDECADSFFYSFTKVDKEIFPIYIREIVSANILEVAAGTNGFHGGDSGNGSRTYIRLKNLGSTDIRIKPIERYGDAEGVEIVLGGDCELSAIITACRFIADVLENQKHNVRTWDEEH